MLVDFDAVVRNEIASMCYARWSAAFDTLKQVKALTWESNKQTCPKADWPLFHTSMLDSAQKEFDLASKLKDTVCKVSPLILGE